MVDEAGDGDDFLELDLGKVKTGNTPSSHNVKKSAAGHANGLGGDRWAKAWLEARAREGRHAKKDGCLLPAFSEQDGWLRRRMRSKEFSAWLKVTLSKMGVPPHKTQKLGSHSGKVTLLTWCAKYGIDRDSRRALG